MRFLLTTLFLISFLFMKSQNRPNGKPDAFYAAKSPREGDNAAKPGHYDFVARINNAILNPGDDLIVEIYITGYGEIQNSKFNFYPSIDVIDYKNSTASFGLSTTPQSDGGTLVGWGGKTVSLDETGFMLDLGKTGRADKRWEKPEPTLYFDINPASTPQIATETSQLGIAPITYRLRIQENVSAGDHFLHFGFTYFDGAEWSGSTQQIQFTVRNIWQRNENWVSIFALIGGLVALLASVFTIIDFFKKKETVPTKTEVVVPVKKDSAKGQVKK